MESDYRYTRVRVYLPGAPPAGVGKGL